MATYISKMQELETLHQSIIAQVQQYGQELEYCTYQELKQKVLNAGVVAQGRKRDDYITALCINLSNQLGLQEVNEQIRKLQEEIDATLKEAEQATKPSAKKEQVMDQKHTIKLERGTLYIKLRETFDTSNMQIHCTLAEVSRNRIHIVKADSLGEVSSTSMTLNAEEFALLTEGMEMVNDWWETSPLKYREVLLDCAHTVEWDEHQAALYRDNRYTLPLKGEETYCWECERTSHIYRLSINDFCETPEDDQQGEDEAIRNAGLDGELRRMR